VCGCALVGMCWPANVRVCEYASMRARGAHAYMCMRGYVAMAVFARVGVRVRVRVRVRAHAPVRAYAGMSHLCFCAVVCAHAYMRICACACACAFVPARMCIRAHERVHLCVGTRAWTPGAAGSGQRLMVKRECDMRHASCNMRHGTCHTHDGAIHDGAGLAVPAYRPPLIEEIGPSL
jgi:hypothetical protein